MKTCYSMYPLAKMEITFCGPAAFHNMPCAICRERYAVFRCNDGFFEPCWECQKEGFVTKKEKPKLILRFWKALGFRP